MKFHSRPQKPILATDTLCARSADSVAKTNPWGRTSITGKIAGQFVYDRQLGTLNGQTIVHGQPPVNRYISTQIYFHRYISTARLLVTISGQPTSEMQNDNHERGEERTQMASSKIARQTRPNKQLLTSLPQLKLEASKYEDS